MFPVKVPKEGQTLTPLYAGKNGCGTPNAKATGYAPDDHRATTGRASAATRPNAGAISDSDRPNAGTESEILSRQAKITTKNEL